MHLKNNVATQCEHGGSIVSSPVAITTDFDNDARYPNPGYPVNASYPPLAPDLGADEFGCIPNDITPPSITYTPLNHTYNGNPRTLTATIVDGGGVPVSGAGLPVLYWKVNTGSYQAAQGTYVSGNTYNFTFGAGTVVGDVVSYYLVAQGMAATPNAGSFPSLGASGFFINPPSCNPPRMLPIPTTSSREYRACFTSASEKTTQPSPWQRPMVLCS